MRNKVFVKRVTALPKQYNKRQGKEMIRKIKREEIEECVKVIRSSFSTVAEEFNITEKNCPTHTSFIKPEKLYFQFDKGCPMFALIKNEKIVGYFSLIPKRDGSAELDNLAVLPKYRHNGYGKEMLEYAFKTAKAMGFNKIQIGIIEENTLLKNWYTKNGFVHTGTQKFEHLPFTVGFMECRL